MQDAKTIDSIATTSTAACGRGVSRRSFLEGMLAAAGALAALSIAGTGAYAQDGAASSTGDKSGASSSQGDATAASQVEMQKGKLDSIKVAFVQLIDNDAFNTMIQGFKDGMKDAGYVEGTNATFDVKNAQGDTATLNSIAADLKNSTDYDVVVPIATPASQAVVNAEIDTPVVFISVTSPVAAGIMGALDKPDMGATGTSNVIPVDEIFNLADKLAGGQVSTIGILYCTGESNAVSTVEKAKEYLDGAGRSYQEATVANSSEVAQAAAQLASKVDMIYVPVDSTVQSAMPELVEAATDAGIPVYGSDPVMVQSGALACVSVSNSDLGYTSAALAVEITNGTPVEDVPCVTFDTFTPVVNVATAKELGIEIPTDAGYTLMGE
ncbi:MAG: ABC transporter substrate-binding protein [Coriobacteriales bacterium]|jgi:putative ABC transport system substrate-binding protein